ncbi:MAG: type II toxin-antitoxin system death-on-curing family toxin [Acidobacteriaceae bacterium]
MSTCAWVWISLKAVLAIHDEQISEHGGPGGVRDLGVVESAVARPMHLMAYGEPDAAAIAAAYTFELCRNHGFVDGNKRTAYVVAETFLVLNGYAMDAPDEAVVETMLAVASGSMSEEELVEWFRLFLR